MIVLTRYKKLYCPLVFSTALFLALFIIQASNLNLKAEERVLIFAASSLKEALEEIKSLHKNNTKILFSFASSSTLARQIEYGAEADIFLSANEKLTDYLQSKNLVLSENRKKIIGNRLVLIKYRPETHRKSERSPANPSILSYEKIKEAIKPPERIVIGDPLHVPAGIYTKKTFKLLGLWIWLKEKIAPAESARTALSHVNRGQASLGIVYYTDVQIASNVEIVGYLPDFESNKIEYDFSLLSNKNPATSFYEIIISEEAIKIFAKHGFIKSSQ